MVDRSGQTAPADVIAALQAVAEAHARLARAGLPWEREHDAAASAAVLLAGRSAGVPHLRTVGLVGGASSGKSTLLNNLVGRVVSDVAIRAHTTEGPIVAATRGRLDEIRALARENAWLLRGAEVREAATMPVTGRRDTITIVPVEAGNGASCLDAECVLVDTPDFTSLAARDAGDLTRAMLPWMDRVIVTIDEDRWFDEQVFGWLRRRLDELGIERLVVFNRCQRGGPLRSADGEAIGEAALTVTEEERLKERARLFAADYVLMPFSPGRGPAVLVADRVRLVEKWIRRPVEGAGRRVPARFEALCAFVGRAAERTLAESARRGNLHADLAEQLRHEAAVLAPDERVLAFEVLLSPQQRRQLDPIYQAIVRPVEWAGKWGRRITGGLASMRDVEGREAHETIAERGKAFFLAERMRLMDRLGTAARRSELCALAGGAGEFAPAPVDDVHGIEQQAASLARACEVAYDAFIERLEAEARSVRLGPVSSGGALAGAVIGGVLAAAPGGVLMPVGAAIGAAVGGVTSAAGARSAWRVVRLMMRTPELRELWSAVRAYRQGLLAEAERERERLLGVAAGTFIPVGDPVERALKRLAALKGGAA